MEKLWCSFAVSLLLLLCIHCLKADEDEVNHKRSCAIEADRAETAHNLKYHCSQKEIKDIFTNSPAGKFPPNGKLKGSVLLDGLQEQDIWNGKKFTYSGGQPPDDTGTLTNIIFRRFEMFDADVYRTNAPVDGKEAFALNYKKDPLTILIIDYIREVQKNLYVGIMTFRPFSKIPIVYFLLEKE